MYNILQDTILYMECSGLDDVHRRYR